MRPEEKVPILELCKKLWTLGITKAYETDMAYAFIEDRKSETHNKTGAWFLQTSPKRGFEKEFGIRIIPAPDLAELGELLPVEPNYFRTYFTVKQRSIPCCNAKAEGYFFAYSGFSNINMANGEATVTKRFIGDHDKNEANLRAKILIALQENKELIISKENPDRADHQEMEEYASELGAVGYGEPPF